MFGTASRMMALRDSLDVAEELIRFPLTSTQVKPSTHSANPRHLLLNRALYLAQTEHYALLDTLIERFDQYIGPRLKYDPNQHTTHKHLLQLLDRKHKQQLFERADKEDKARYLAITNNGASSWMDIVPNKSYGVVYSNRFWWINLSLYMGSAFISVPQICRKCGSLCDIYGYHALHCPYGGLLIEKHDSCVNLLEKFFVRGGYTVRKEQRFDWEKLERLESERGRKVNIEEVRNMRPGDLWVQNYNSGGDRWFDFGGINVMQQRTLNGASKKRLFAAMMREKDKIDKYGSDADFTPLIIESFGGIGPQLKQVLQHLAERIGTRKGLTPSVVMHRLRKRLVALMSSNDRINVYEIVTIGVTIGYVMIVSIERCHGTNKVFETR
eukprot:72201_1